MKQAVGSDIVFVDVWDQPSHPSLPGAILMPGAGSSGSFDDDAQRRLWTALSQATNRQAERPIVFFCTGSRCWESYNAALRAVNMGFKMVLWYRGGLAAWQAAGRQMATSGQPSQAPAPARIGFGQ
jgi:PQQ-dependent catabolism-associated CXXCW motif protein